MRVSEALSTVLVVVTIVCTMATANAAGGVSTLRWGVTVSGYKWDHPDLSYWLNDSCDRTESKAIDSAFVVWHQAFPYFTFYHTHQVNDEIDVFCNAHLRADELGRSQRILRVNIIEHVDMFFGEMPIEKLMTVALHEIGHALGLGHSYDPDDVMYYRVVKTGLAPSSKDVQSLYMLYETPDTESQNLPIIFPYLCLSVSLCTLMIAVMLTWRRKLRSASLPVTLSLIGITCKHLMEVFLQCSPVFSM
jgi:hypothetical protein